MSGGHSVPPAAEIVRHSSVPTSVGNVIDYEPGDVSGSPFSLNHHFNKMKRFSTIFLLSLSLLFVVTIIGCSDGRLKTEPVRGVVTFDGEPLADATVSFHPKESGAGAAGFARTNEKGEYLLQTIQGNPDAGTLPGEYSVTIAKYIGVPTGKKLTNDYGEVTDELNNVSVVPEIYVDPKKTPFSATVVKGKNQFDFDVKSK